MKQKINIHLTIIALLAVLLVTFGVTLVYYSSYRDRVLEDLRTEGRLLAASQIFLQTEPGQEDAAAMESTEAPNAKELTAAPTPEVFDRAGIRITWVAADGTVLYDNGQDAAALENHLDRPEVADAFRNSESMEIRRSDTMRLNTFYYAMRLDNGTVLRVATQVQTVFSVIRRTIPVILGICAVIVLLCILLGNVLTVQLLKPLSGMAESLSDPKAVPVYSELEPFVAKIRDQHENLLAAVSSRQDFTANISHELKTPLTAISGYAELIENRMVGPDEDCALAGKIRKNSERLLSLINDIIRLSEFDQREIPKIESSVDLYELVQECCQDLQFSAEKHNVTLTVAGERAMITADRAYIKELIENLVLNAIRYNVPNGRVHVTVRADSEGTSLCVTDTGIGIPKDKQSRVFERFYRVDKSHSQATGGTGLGLAIVKHIAEIHDAKIVLKSSEGAGTEITVVF